MSSALGNAADHKAKAATGNCPASGANAINPRPSACGTVIDAADNAAVKATRLPAGGAALGTVPKLVVIRRQAKERWLRREYDKAMSAAESGVRTATRELPDFVFVSTAAIGADT